MQANDFVGFISILHAVTEIYGKNFSEGVQKIFFNALKQYDIEDVKSAFNQHVTSPDNGQFPPKPADIVKILEGTSKNSASLAWTKLDKAVRMVGTYESVCFDDNIINAVVRDLGGWITLGEKSEDEWVFLANDFKARYLAYKQRKDHNVGMGRLVGLNEADAIKRGFKVPPVVLLGNQEEALRVSMGVNGETFKIGTADKLKIELKKIGD